MSKEQKEVNYVSEPILKVEHLKKYYPLKKGIFGGHKQYIKSVDDVSFELYQGETLGIVGESGCGKSTAMKCILHITEPTEGLIQYKGTDISRIRDKNAKNAKEHIGLIFQDPYSSLNPRMTVEDIIAEPLDIAKAYRSSQEREMLVCEIMKKVGLNTDFRSRYPHEFSGGQRQRIGIARAIITNPEVLICDEPVSALDVSVQAKIINLLKEIQKNLNMSYIFISHDLGVVRHIADRIEVMYLGHIVEEGECEEIFNNPRHPYTKALLECVPKVGRKQDSEYVLEGEIPSPANPPKGCCFHTRCKYATKRCEQEKPEFSQNSKGHKCACFLETDTK